ncbi:recombinase family protein [Pseudoalteromonas sp. T1lg23B]|uniref:recombinase family protein n=1 Tax=Pseudoalteromonas sp. T1lg23B TaxID=2077097 RepID=UPI003FA3A4D8
MVPDAKLDRLSRNVHFLTRFQRSGVEFVCCDIPDANNVTVQLMVVLAENETRNISIKTKEALSAVNGISKETENHFVRYSVLSLCFALCLPCTFISLEKLTTYIFDNVGN